jgi:hypothetical protein
MSPNERHIDYVPLDNLPPHELPIHKAAPEAHFTSSSPTRCLSSRTKKISCITLLIVLVSCTVFYVLFVPKSQYVAPPPIDYKNMTGEQE